MNTKICFKCGVKKDLSEYYKHPKMSDGYLNKCKTCTKKDTKLRTDILIQNSEWKKKELERHRKKYHRLGYKEKIKLNTETKKISMIKYKEKYPEKYKAKIKSQRIKKHTKTNHLHHWSYNEKHYTDVIELTEKEHNKIHRFIIYDQERFMYRRIDTMELLDTRLKHEDYINYIIKNKED